MIWSFEMDMENSWILEIVKTLILFIGGIFGGIGAGLYAERRSRKNRHLSEFASAVRSEIRSLNEKGDNLDLSFMNWHFDSIRRLDQYADYMKDFDKKRWIKIEECYEEYRPPSNDLNTYIWHLNAWESSGKPLGKRLNNLLHKIRNA